MQLRDNMFYYVRTNENKNYNSDTCTQMNTNPVRKLGAEFSRDNLPTAEILLPTRKEHLVVLTSLFTLKIERRLASWHACS